MTYSQWKTILAIQIHLDKFYITPLKIITWFSSQAGSILDSAWIFNYFNEKIETSEVSVILFPSGFIFMEIWSDDLIPDGFFTNISPEITSIKSPSHEHSQRLNYIVQSTAKKEHTWKLTSNKKIN